MIRIGVDFGGTKIEAAGLDAQGRIVSRVRTPNPGAYEAAISAVADLIGKVEAEGGASRSVGMGAPGSISPRTGLIRNSNSLYLNGRNFRGDLEAALGRPIRVANDANCLALSEAVDGAGQGAPVVFAAILGTGCGGGIVVDGRLLEGANGVAGEWGHTPLPWQTDEERNAAPCWCGRRGCLEIWISGSAFVADHHRRTGRKLDGKSIMAAARAGDAAAVASFDAYVDRTGRALGAIINILDPDAIILGGGMSNSAELYDRLPDSIRPHVFADAWETPIRQAAHGDSSGVRGAAWLWPLEGGA